MGSFSFYRRLIKPHWGLHYCLDPRHRIRSQSEMQFYRPYNVLMMRDLPERHVILSVSDPVNNVQVKSKFENRKEMLPGSLLATPLRCLRWDFPDSNSTLQTFIYFVPFSISLRTLRLSLNFAFLLEGVFYKPLSLAVASLAGTFST